MTPTALRAGRPFASFWMGGYEGADHLNSHALPLDMVASTGHLAHLDADHRSAAELGIRTLRESLGWRLAERSPGRFDFDRARRIAASAQRHGLQLVWTFMHYGTPADVSLLDDAFIDRFAAFAGAAAQALAEFDDAPVYNLVNEISFLAWAVVETRVIHPYGATSEGSTERSGFEIKRRLVRAVLAGIEAVRRVDPRARFLHVDPILHVVAPRDRPDLQPLAERITAYQWQAWDLIAGRVEPELGGSDEALDLIGVNHYHSGQWEAGTEHRLDWHARDGRRRPLADLLGDVWNRYRKPLIVAETSHVGMGRSAWLHEVASEARRALRAGVPLAGICLYPLVDRHDWDATTHWHRSGLWDVDGEVPPIADAPPPVHVEVNVPAPVPAARFDRTLSGDYATALAHWTGTLPLQVDDDLPTLVVFSHLRWDFVWQRPQQLLSRLARDHRVLFVEEPIADAGAARLDRMPRGPNIEVLVPRTNISEPGFQDGQLAALGPLLTAYLRDHGIDRYAAWFCTPMASPLLEWLRPQAVVYDCIDELSAFRDPPLQLPEREMALLQSADLVFAAGPSLLEAKRLRRPDARGLFNAVTAAHFSPDARRSRAHEAEVSRLQGEWHGPRLGFYGVIDERLDIDLLQMLTDAQPDWQFVMVGPVVKIDPATLPRADNLRWIGWQPYELLPCLQNRWDVCLLPFKLDGSTRFNNPTKILEYVAGEKPVVAAALADVGMLYGKAVRLAADQTAFLAACDAALAEDARTRDERVQACRELAARHSWDEAAEQARLALAQVSPRR